MAVLFMAAVSYCRLWHLNSNTTFMGKIALRCLFMQFKTVYDFIWVTPECVHDRAGELVDNQREARIEDILGPETIDASSFVLVFHSRRFSSITALGSMFH